MKRQIWERSRKRGPKVGSEAPKSGAKPGASPKVGSEAPKSGASPKVGSEAPKSGAKSGASPKVGSDDPKSGASPKVGSDAPKSGASPEVRSDPGASPKPGPKVMGKAQKSGSRDQK